MSVLIYRPARLTGGLPAAHAPKAASTADEENGVQAHLQLHDAYGLANAMLFAEHEGRWLNSIMTISWELCAGAVLHGPEDLQEVQAKTLKHIHRVMRRERKPLYCAWVKENGPCGERVGVHSHLFIHLEPEQWRLDYEVINKAGGEIVKPIRNSGVKFNVDRQNKRPGYRSRREMCRQVIYSMKGLAPKTKARLPDGSLVLVREHLQLQAAAKEAGLRCPPHPTPAPWPRWGKVAGCSVSLGPAARAAAGWVELTTPSHLRDAIWKGYSPLNDAEAPPEPWVRGGGVPSRCG